MSKLISTIDRASGKVLKSNPRLVTRIFCRDVILMKIYERVLTKSTSAEVQITLRTGTLSSPSSATRAIPLEPFAANKDMGRILIRRGGETIAAGEYVHIVVAQESLTYITIGIVIDVDNSIN
jgi:elongation factor 1 alpha-like protein